MVFDFILDKMIDILIEKGISIIDTKKEKKEIGTLLTEFQSKFDNEDLDTAAFANYLSSSNFKTLICNYFECDNELTTEYQVANMITEECKQYLKSNGKDIHNEEMINQYFISLIDLLRRYKYSKLSKDNRELFNLTSAKINETSAKIMTGQKEILKKFDESARYKDTIEKHCKNIPYNKNKKFIGRKEILDNLFSTLSKTKVQVITGMSGVGKTQLCVKYSYDNIDRYDYMFWVRADSDINIFDGYINIGKDLCIIDKVENKENSFKKVISWLKDNDNWLLVLDNCADYEQIYRYIPNNTKGHIIITSINPNWKRLNTPIELELFTEEESVQFFYSYIEVNDESEDLKELVKKLGYLPLALSQAASYIEENSIDLRNYIDLYDKYNLRLFDKNYCSVEYEYTINTVWKISLEKIKYKSNLTIKLIKFLSLFYNNKIPNWLIKKNMSILKEVFDEDVDELEYNKCISLLKSYSIIEVDKKYFSMHCLTQKVIQDQLKSDKEYNEYIEDIVFFLKRILPVNVENTEKNIGIVDWIPQINYVICKISNDCNNNIEYLELLFRYALILRIDGRYEEAEVEMREALEKIEPLFGRGNYIYLRGKALWAGILKDLGDISKAYKIYEEILDISKVDNKNDANTTSILNSMALILREQGKLNEAKKVFEEALNSNCFKNNDYQGLYATIMINLSTVNLDLNEYDLAINNINHAIKLIISVYSKESIQYARAINNKANIFSREKKYIEAKALYEKAIKVSSNIYGSGNVEILNQKRNLARCLSQTGKENWTKSQEMVEDIIKHNVEIYGDKSKIVADDYEALGDIYFVQKKYELSIINYSKCKEIYLSLSNDYENTVLDIVRNIIICHMSIGTKDNFVKALDLCNLLLDYEKILVTKGDKNIKGLYLQDLLINGKLYYKLDDYNEGIKVIKKCLKISKTLYGEFTEETIMCYFYLSLGYYELSVLDKAYKYAEKQLKCNLRVYKYDSIQVAVNYSNLAYILYELGSKRKSQEYIEKAISIMDNNNFHDKSAQTVRADYEGIRGSTKSSIFDTLKKYEFEFIESNNTLIINPKLKNDKLHIMENTIII